jgi:hypothetical protein
MKTLSKQELKLLYEKYVMNKYFYRAISQEYLSNIKKNGLTPKKSPFNNFKKELRQFLSLLYSLDKRGYKIVYAWHHEIPPLAKLLRVLRKDLRKKYIDLSRNLEENSYYIKRKGGSLVTTILELSDFIKNKEYPLNKLEQVLFDKVVLWCKKRASYPMLTIKIPRTSIYLEKAHFQNFIEKYWSSPFGRFEHFCYVINRHGWEKYGQILVNDKNFYIRLTKKVPAREIIFKK